MSAGGPYTQVIFSTTLRVPFLSALSSSHTEDNHVENGLCIHIHKHTFSFYMNAPFIFYSVNFSRFFFLLKNHCFCATESNFNFKCFICLTSLPQWVVKRLYFYGMAPRSQSNKNSFTLTEYIRETAIKVHFVIRHMTVKYCKVTKQRDTEHT